MIRLFGRPPPLPRFGSLAPRQAEACAVLHGAAFAHGWSAMEFERLIAARSSWADAALDGRTGALVGFILSRGAAGEAEVLTIVVNEDWRGRGVGRQLLVRHMAQLVTGRIGELFLEVNEDNAAARKLYATAGFAEVGRREGYYRPRPDAPALAALILRRALT